ncbi:polymyxin resistance protein ArnA, partial [Candidatus Woesearchaeota archaeon CG10_big_fil_rev_8_21_14_0_10_47_5]
NLIKRVSPELIVMCGWRQIIRRGIIDIPPKGVIGFHPTPLPKGRGPAPLINSIMQGFRESAITMFYISEGLDDGDIIGQEWFRIEETDHAAEVYEKCIVGGKKLISKYIPMIADGTAPRMPQDSSKATVFEKPSLKNNRIDLDKESIEEVYRKIRALSKPYRGAYIEKDGKRLVIWRAGLEG